MTPTDFAFERMKAARLESDDPDTQTACVLQFHEPGLFLSSANKFPSGVTVTPPRTARPAKYRFVMHAERRVLALAARLGLKTHEAITYLTWFPCAECAAMLAQAGIAKVICNREAYEARHFDPLYGFAEAMEILTEAGIEIEWY